MNLLRLLKSIGFIRQLDSRNSYPQVTKRAICSACNGTGRVVIGLGAVCTEPVENVGKCPHCFGAGYRLESQKDYAIVGMRTTL